jgi:XTP/dITP diphosphohydrolase
MPQPLLIATRNANKTREITRILGAHFSVADLTSHPEIPEPLETGATFRDNAVLKASEASRRFDGLVLSDDSGLEVDALGGAPGVRSARYAGEPCDDARNRRRLLDELERAGARGRARSARFHCVMALAQNGGVTVTFDGVIEGVITNREKGAGGFGYDSLFVPEGYCETFAELSDDVKNSISHRSRALEKLRKFLSCA